MSGEKRSVRSTSSVVYIVEFMEQINKVSLLE